MNKISRISYLIRFSPLFRSVLWLGLSVVFVIISVILSIHHTTVPAITAITPSEGAPGESVTISGRGFGTSKAAHYVQFSNCNIAAKSITAWSENEIILLVPPDVQSGFVKVGGKKTLSNGVFFTNTQLQPVPYKKSESAIDNIMDIIEEEEVAAAEVESGAIEGNP